MSETNLQKKARVRANLKRQLTNGNLIKAIDKAIKEGAISIEECEKLSNIKFTINSVLEQWFDNTKKVGLKAKRRCTICGRIAKYKVIFPIFATYRCAKCAELEYKFGTYKEINPDD